MDRLAGNHERTFHTMMKCLRMFLEWVNPGFENLKDKEVVFSYHLLIYNLAFKISIAFIDKRSLDARGRHRCETKLFELVDHSPRGVPTVHYLFRQLHRWNIDYAFFGCFHYIEGVRNYIKSDKHLDRATTHTWKQPIPINRSKAKFDWLLPNSWILWLPT